VPKAPKRPKATVQVSKPAVKLPSAIQLRPYQQNWIMDNARFKIALKAARTGFSYGEGVEAILDCIEHADGGTTWTVLSASKAQSIEFVESAQKNLQLIGAVAQLYDEPFADIDGISSVTQSRIQLLDSRIIALPANPRTARGYPGNAILDEHAHQEDSYAIWAAVARQVALGHKLRSISTANGEQGKYFDLCREFGIIDGVEPTINPFNLGVWSIHWVDVYKAVREGCPINVEEMRELFKDEDLFAQEFLCVFLKAGGAWIPLELVAQAEDPGATLEFPSGYKLTGPGFGGIDVARDRDKTVFWFDERIGDIAWTRAVIRLHAMPLPQQARELAPYCEMCTRVAIDATGMGVGLYDMLNEQFPGKMIGVNFGGTNDKGVKFKTEMATTLKRRLEQHKDRIPHDQDVRQALTAVKREPTPTGVKFDAPRIEVDSGISSGKKKKMYGHADEFWAKGLANLAAGSVPPAAMAGSGDQEHSVRRDRQSLVTGATVEEMEHMTRERDGRRLRV
jgi:phage FluMu gp28-like protein